MYLKLFKRVVSKGTYRPEIDGLRFIAIIAVLIFHVDAFLTLYMDKASALSSLWFTGHYGVPLFFSISGFVLSSQLLKTKKFSYKQYLIRRIERIEPPFLITTIAFYLLLSFRDGFDQEKNYSLFRVLTYTSNFDTNLINVVTWSLEIEVVFYLLLPLLYLLAKDTIWKWSVLAVCTFVFSQFYRLPFLNTYFHWFAIGIIIAILETKKTSSFSYKLLGQTITLLCLILFFGLAHYETLLVIEIVQPILLFFFLYGVLIQKYFLKYLSFTSFTIVGGACYIIYLIHFQVISVTGHLLIPIIAHREILSLVLVVVTTLLCLMAFPVLERPFMKKGWWKIKS